MKVIELHRSVTESNDRDADALREYMKDKKCLLINLMSAPGSGKTTLLMKLIHDMKENVQIGVMEADIDSAVDAERITAAGAMSIQVHTDGMCHMDAGMTAEGIHNMNSEGMDVIFLENVGNLICPAEFDTGAGKNIMILSVPEGDDKPLKYPLMFETSDALIITKTDTAKYFNFDFEKCRERVRRLNPDIHIFEVSAKTGEGMNELEEWLIHEIEDWKGTGE